MLRIPLFDSSDSQIVAHVGVTVPLSQKTMGPIINRNYQLYGPGPLARRMGGIASRPPLQSLVITACQGLVIGLGAAFAWKFGFGDPETKAFEDYYKANPPR